MATSRDECVVDSAPLAALVTGFVSTWTRTRPAIAGRFAGRDGRVGDASAIGALDWLAAEARVPRRTIENLAGRRPKNATTELRIADALVTAIGCPEVFHDGPPGQETLPIRQNPHVRRRSCCSGSLTGEA